MANVCLHHRQLFQLPGCGASSGGGSEDRVSVAGNASRRSKKTRENNVTASTAASMHAFGTNASLHRRRLLRPPAKLRQLGLSGLQQWQGRASLNEAANASGPGRRLQPPAVTPQSSPTCWICMRPGQDGASADGGGPGPDRRSAQSKLRELVNNPMPPQPTRIGKHGSRRFVIALGPRTDWVRAPSHLLSRAAAGFCRPGTGLPALLRVLLKVALSRPFPAHALPPSCLQEACRSIPCVYICSFRVFSPLRLQEALLGESPGYITVPFVCFPTRAPPPLCLLRGMPGTSPGVHVCCFCMYSAGRKIAASAAACMSWPATCMHICRPGCQPSFGADTP